jgi:hypothetical protein
MTISSKNLPTAPEAFTPAPLSITQQQTITDLVLGGDLSKMGPEQRVSYYVQLCHSLSLNPLTQPFQILKFQGKEILYATKSCTEQLRKLQGVSVTKLEPRAEGDVYLVVAYVVDSTGRTDAATGAVQVTNLKGEALANAFMKAETKAKRRATLSLCGLGILDESELDTLPQAVKVGLPQAAEIGTSAEEVVESAPAAPVATEPNDEAKVAGHRTRLLYAKKIEDVAQIWGEVPKHLKPELLADKDAAKKRFEQPAPKPQPVRDEQLMREFIEQPELGMGQPATDAQREEIKRLINLQTITPGEKADMLKVLYKLDEVRAGQAIFKLLNEMAVREGRDADREMRQAMHKFLYNKGERLGADEVSRLTALNEDSTVHWQMLRAELMAASDNLRATLAIAA